MRLIYHPRDKYNDALPNEGKCLDLGALDFTQYFRIKDSKPGIQHFGVDYINPTKEIPQGYTFKKADLNKEPIPFEDDTFDFIIASHIIEHLNDPLNFFQECIRVLKPNGLFYLEAPSEKSLTISGMNFDFEAFYSLNMYDDPTHTKRPWTPNSFWRMAKYFGANPIKADYVWSWNYRILAPFIIPIARLTKNGKLLEKLIWFSKGWASYLIVSKTKPGNPEFNYYIPLRNKI
jgi:SAM-dependent methyltransferase